MTDQSVAARELRLHLSEHLDEVLRGQRYVVTRNGRAVAELGPVEGRSASVREDDQ